MEAQASDNKIQQEDEIAVLQSIFLDEVTRQEEDNTQHTCIEIVVPCMIPQPLVVTLKTTKGQAVPPLEATSSKEDTKLTEGGGDEHTASLSSFTTQSYTFVALPPLKLEVELNDMYPSHEPPTYRLSSAWLSVLQLNMLCKQLDSMWDECKGDVILFRWVSWLREETAAFLHITSPYELPCSISPEATSKEEATTASTQEVVTAMDELHVDPRVHSSCTPAIIRLLREFDKQERKQIFEQSSHTCDICYSDGPGYEFIHQTLCDHTFCRECMREFCRVHIQSGSIDQIKCPEKTCRQQVLPHVVRQLVTPELYAKYEKLLLERSLSAMSDIMFCPMCNMAVIIDIPLQLGACNYCKYTFCSLCLALWHPARACTSLKGMLQGIEKLKANSTQKDLSAKMQSEIDSLLWLNGNTKPCPTCRTLIEKNDGCNKMTCFKCGNYFCWLCVERIMGYSHFGGKCQLFPEIEDDYRYVAPIAHADPHPNAHPAHQHHMRGDVHVEPAPLKKCPRCKSDNERTQNKNHMRCWNCRSQFCYLCSRVIQGTTHFSPKGCKLHSDL